MQLPFAEFEIGEWPGSRRPFDGLSITTRLTLLVAGFLISLGIGWGGYLYLWVLFGIHLAVERRQGRTFEIRDDNWALAGASLLHALLFLAVTTVCAYALRRRLSASGQARLLFLFLIPVILVGFLFFPFPYTGP